MFSEDQIRLSQSRFRGFFDSCDFLYRAAAEEFLEIVPTLKKSPKTVLILGSFPLLKELKLLCSDARIEHIEQFYNVPRVCEGADYDLVVSLGQLQWVNDPIKYLQFLGSLVRFEGGVWVGFVGGDSFSNLRQALIRADLEVYGGAYTRVIPMIGASDGLKLMQAAGLKKPVVNRLCLELLHSNLSDLMVDLRHMGASNPAEVRPKHLTTRRVFQVASDVLCKEEQGINTPVEIITLSAFF